MRIRLLIILTCWTLASCEKRNSETASVDDDADKLLFEEYLRTLKPIDIPTNLTSILSTDGSVYDYGKFRRFKTIWSDKPFGKLFVINDKTVTADLQIGSGYGLAIVVYDQDGHKIDSLYALKDTDSDTGSETTEEVSIDKDKKIIVTRLTERWKLSADNSSRIENTKTISKDTITYIVEDDGRIKEIKD